MSAPTTDPAVNRISLGGLLAGLVAVATAIGSAVTGHGGNLTDALTALGGSGISIASVWKYIDHRTTIASAIHTAEATAAVVAQPIVRTLADVDPAAAAQLKSLAEEAVPQLRQDLANALPQVEQYVEKKLASYVPSNFEQTIRQVLTEVFTGAQAGTPAHQEAPGAATAPAAGAAATTAG